jgi:AAA+ superfamily predicted ATPase
MSNVYDELTERLRRTDLLLLRAVKRQRERPAIRSKGQFWGAMMTDDEIDELLREHGEVTYPRSSDDMGHALRAAEAIRDRAGGRIGRIRESFKMSGDDVDLLLLALAPEVSAGYARIFAYLNDNLSQSFLTVDLATRVIRTRRRERLELQTRLLHGSALVKHRLLLLSGNEGTENHPNRRIQCSPRMLRWLLEEEELPASPGVTELATDVEPFIPGDTRKRLEGLSERLNSPQTFVIVGSTRGSREAVAQSIARRAGRPVLRVDMERAAEYLEQPGDLIRELLLSGAIPYLVNVVEAQDDPAQRVKLLNLGSALSGLPHAVLVGAADRRSVNDLLGAERPSATVMCARSSYDEREAAWEAGFESMSWSPHRAPELAERFYSIGGTTIHRVLERAHAESGGHEPDDETLLAAAREGSRPEFRGLAQHVIPRYRWDDLILSDKVSVALQHLVNYLKHQETVFHHWGARAIRARGYGIKALFSGAPGTGKTMAAEVIAGSLGLDLFRVDLSQVISRWVGETEKNLKEIFDAAEGGVAVLLFDEADALFGSRGDVKQAQDRFANQEVSFLLQRLEVFEGCAILTTNLQENIDEAFLRRFGAVVEFPMPSAEERLQLWQRAIPKQAPRGDDLDLDHLAQQFHIAGGSIINAAINGCVLAATEGSPVCMGHIVRAIGQELVKMGKQVNRVHFGKYFDLVADL